MFFVLVFLIPIGSLEVSSTNVTNAPGFIGCLENKENISTLVVPRIGAAPAEITPKICADQCSNIDYAYAGIQGGDLCMCGQEQPQIKSANCTEPCAGDGRFYCGGQGVWSVYNTPPNMNGLDINVTGALENGYYALFTGIEVVTNLLSLKDANFTFRFSDRSNSVVGPQTTGSVTASIVGTGKQAIGATIQYKQNFARVAKSIQVENTVPKPTLKCPAFVNETQKFECTVYLDQGVSAKKLVVDMQDGTVVKFSSQDSNIFSTGRIDPPKTGLSSIDVTKPHFLFNDIIKYRGTAGEYEIDVSSAGKLNFDICRPSCPEKRTFCFRSYSCVNLADDCPKTKSVWNLKCESPLVYDFRKRTCVNAAGQVKTQGYFADFSSLITNYTSIVHLETDLKKSGKNLVKIDGNVIVEPGDVIVVQGDNRKVNSVQVAGPYTATYSGSIKSKTLASPQGINHQLLVKVYYLRSLEVRFTHTYANQEMSKFNVTASVDGKENASMVIDVLVPIRDVKIDCPEAAKTNESVTLFIPHHFGSDVRYIWRFADQLMNESTSNTTTHTFNTTGVHNITLVAVNSVSREEVSKQIIIQDEVLNLMINTTHEYIRVNTGHTTIHWWILQGTNVTSIVTLEPGSATKCCVGTSNPGIVNNGLNGFNRANYKTAGVKDVVVNITNLVSWKAANTTVYVQEEVGSLNISDPIEISVNAIKKVKFTIGSGTDLKYNISLDGVVISDVMISQTKPITAEMTIPAQSAVQNKTLNVTIYNNINAKSRQVALEVDIPIRKAFKVYVDRPFAPTAEDVNVTISGVNATRVAVEYNFGDGTPVWKDWFKHCNGDAIWTAHQFSSPGNFTISASLSNPLGTIRKEIMVLVQHPVKAINFSSNSPLEMSYDQQTKQYVPLKGMIGTHFIADSGVAFPTDPTYAVWVNDYNLTDTAPFTMDDQKINFTIFEPGTYLVYVNISNLVSFLNFTHHLEADVPIQSIQSAYFGVDLAAIGQNLTFGATVIGGSRIKLMFDFQDGLNETIGTPGGVLEKVYHAYQTDGRFLVNVTASNSVSAFSTTNNVMLSIQIPVNGLSLEFVPEAKTSIQEIKQGATYTAKYRLKLAKDELHPTNLTCRIHFGDGANDTAFISKLNPAGRRRKRSLTPSKCTTTGGCLLKEFMHVYSRGRPYIVRANLSNAVSQKHLNISVNIYERIVNLAIKVMYYDPFMNGQDKMRGGWLLNGKQNAFPTSYSIYGIATRDWGSPLNMTWKFGAKTLPIVYNNMTSPEQVFTKPGLLSIDLTAINLINTDTAPTQNIVLRQPVGDIALQMDHLVIRNTSLAITLTLGNNAEGSCYYINFRDETAEPCYQYMYGDLTTCQQSIHRPQIAAISPNCKNFFTPAERAKYQNGIVLPSMKMMTAASYTVQLYAINAVSSKDLPIELIVTRGPCYPPEVTLQIPDICSQPNAAQEFPDCIDRRRYPGAIGILRSESLTVYSTPVLNCTSSNVVNYTWSVQKYHGGQFVEMTTDDLNGTSLSSNTMRMIYFNPRLFSYGNYRVTLNVSMHGEQGIFTIVSGTIFVMRTPLVVSIVGGYETTMKWFANVSIAAGVDTHDPDDRDRDNSKLTFEWYCRKYCETYAKYDKFYNVVEEGKLCSHKELTPILDAASHSDSTRSLTTIGCIKFKDEMQYPGLMYSPTGERYGKSIFAVDTSLWNEAFDIVLKLTIRKMDPYWENERTASTEQLVSVVNGDPPDVKLECVTNCQQKMNPSSRFSLGTVITNFPGLRDFGFNWTLKYVKVEGRTISFVTIPQEAWTKSVPTGVSRDYISIYPAVNGYFNNLKQDSTVYKYTLLVLSWRPINPGVIGKSSHPFLINDTPKPGKCRVDPPEGTAIGTEFNVYCDEDCTDPDGPLEYAIAYRKQQADDPIWIYDGNNATMDKASMLPMGLESLNYMLNVTLRCTDRLGALTDMFLPVKVLPPTPATIENTLSKWSAVKKKITDLLAAADLAGFAQFIGLYANYLNDEAAQDDIQYTTDLNMMNQTFDVANPPPQRNPTLLKRQEQRTQYRELVVEEFISMTPPTMGVLSQLASALGVVTMRKDELSLKSISLLYTILKDNCILSIERANRVESSAEAIESVSRFLLGVLGNAAIGAGEVSKNAKIKIRMLNSPTPSNQQNKQKKGSDSQAVLSKAEVEKLIAKLDQDIIAAKAYVEDLQALVKSCMVKIVMQRKVPGEEPSVMTTESMSLSLEKRFSEALAKKPITPGNRNLKDSITVPPPKFIVGEGNHTTYFVETKCLSISSNIYTYSNNSGGNNAETSSRKDVTTGLLSLDMRNETGHMLVIENLPEPFVLYIERKHTGVPDASYLSPTQLGEDMLVHSVQVPADVTFGIKVIVGENVTDPNETSTTDQPSTTSRTTKRSETTSPSTTSSESTSTTTSSSTSKSTSESTTSSQATPTPQTDSQNFTNNGNVPQNATSTPYTLEDDNSLLLENITRFLVFVKVGAQPTVSDHDYNCSLPKIDPPSDKTTDGENQTSGPTFGDKNTCLFTHLLNGTSSPVYVGIKALNGTADPANASLDDYIETLYNVSFFTSDCLYWDNVTEEWSNAGCKVGELTTIDVTQCKCNHLTSFGSSFKIPVAKIDFSGGFLNPNNNPVVFGTMVSLLCLYLILLIWAIKADRNDLVRAGMTPLPDNDPRDRYLYEIIVTTGEAKEAGTTAQVSFIITGEEGDTGPRVLMDEKRKVLQKGDVNSFIMAVQKPLGQMSHLRIWHDNGGKNPSWFFNQMQVTDIQTLERYMFICDKWLAVEQEDGLIDRIIPLAGDIEMKDFNYLFWSKTRKDLSDGHIWLSVFKRPPKSNFTRVQRLTCCLTLVYVSMMASLTFYKGMAMQQNVTQIVIGPIKFTLEQLVVSVLASLIIVPVNVFIVLLFRMSAPWPVDACRCRHRRNKRVCDSIYVAMKNSEAMEIELQNEKEYLDTGERKLATPTRRNWSETHHDPISYTDASGYDQTIPETPKGKKKKKKLVLPWWCVIVGHSLAFVAVAISFYFANMFSKDLGLAGSKEWIASFAISLFQSILLQQPIKVLFLALLYALIIKKPDLDEPDFDEYDNNLRDNEEWLHEPYGNSPDIKEKIARYKAIPLPPDEEELKAARDKRLKEIEMVNVIWEIIFYTIYVGILMVLSYENRDTRSHNLYNEIANVFYNDKYTRNVSVGTNALSAVQNFDQFWAYAENSLIPGMFGRNMYPGDDWYKYRNYIIDRQSFRVCVPRLRQLRMKPGRCFSKLDEIFHDECRPSYSMFTQEEGDYKAGWIPVNKSDPNDKPDIGFGYSTAWQLKGSPTSGKFATYSGGGYVVDLGTHPAQAREALRKIKAGNWLDKNTRCVMVEFLLYNNNVRLYVVSFLMAEFLNSGGAFPLYKVAIMRLEKGMTPTNSMMFFFQFIFLGFLIYFTVRASKRLRKIGRRQYFGSFWDVYEFAVIFMGFVAIFMQIIRFFGAYAMAELMVDRTKFINLDYVVLYDELSVYLLAMIVFLSTLQGLKLLRFNKRICALAYMLKWLSFPLMRFLVVFMILFLAFVCLCHMIFMVRLREYSTFISSMESLLNLMLNKFNFRRMQQVSPYMAPVMFVAFVILVNFIMVNFMIAIILEGYTYAMDCIAGQANEYEIVDFMMLTLKKAIGVTRTERSHNECRLEYLDGAQDSADERCRELSNRVDLIISRLENYIKKQADSKDVMAEMELMKKSAEKPRKRNIIIS